MNAHPQPAMQEMPSGPHKAVPSLRTLLVADWVDSTGLVERLGDRVASQLFHQHDLLLERLLERCQGRLIDKADGILALFSRPVQAVEFAFRYQQGLRELAKQLDLDSANPLAARVGIHVGEVMLWANPPERVALGAKPIEVEGLAKPVAARLMSLAMPHQILMSGMAQTLAQRAQEDLAEFGKVHWQVHGRYRFKGVPAPMIVHEVGLPGINPLRLPPSSEKAKREVPLWRQPVVLAMEGALLAGMVGFGLWSALQSEPAIAFAERDWVVLGDVQNLTAEPTFSGSLDTAWRVGMEQSKYVNVVSELQEESALQRMRREGQGLDRSVGAELALREDAKALVLPTVAEVGGRVRVSAEIIDPATGVTVHTVVADGKGRDSVLSASDEVMEGVREYLGEPEKDLQQRSLPLAQVTTGNLEALKAYSLGLKAKSEARQADAVAFFRRALELDPNFALANVAWAAVAFVIDDVATSDAQMAAALAKASRLSERERLYLSAAEGFFHPGPDSVARWTRLAEVYPDEYRAYYNAAWMNVWYHERYPEALKALQPALSERNPRRRNAYYLKGAIELSLNRTDDALSSFAKAEELGVRGYAAERILATLLTGDAGKARALTLAQNSEGFAGAGSFDLRPLAWIAMQSDGDADALKELQAIAAKPGHSAVAQAQLAWDQSALKVLGMRQRLGTAELTRLRKALEEVIRDGSANERSRAIVVHAGLAWLAARSGNAEAARATLKARRPPSGGAVEFHAASQLYALAEAELDIQQGRARPALTRIAPLLAAPNSLYLTRDVAMRAHLSLGQTKEASLQRDWLLKNAGKAYGENSAIKLTTTANVLVLRHAKAMAY